MTRRHHPTKHPRAAAPAPASAGHQPIALVLALSACFAGPALAQPSGAQAIHGAATLSQQGNALVVTTQNGAGSQHSAINWQSFNVPAGTTTHFAQPGAASTSINRVMGADPSAIFGTLSSNGRLVLVNPAGIAVGAGAVVDTAGFTASTLRMSDADALAGRMRFGDGIGASLRVDGQVLARGGDVVLIGTDVQAGAGAVIRSPEGATILAAGQKVEVTGRGLEGIRFELQAGTDQAVNLGALSGDAVGVFAGRLRHSGVIRVEAVSTEGGKVVLRAGGLAEAAGSIQAQRTGGQGGQVDVLGATVGVLDGSSIDTSNASGGGQIRIGGDFQGANTAVPNAQVTYVGGGAQLRADATAQGDGGRVIVWSDGTTRAYGRISAQGAGGGLGGLVETSGRRHLDVESIRGVQAGTWLLDPDGITIVASTPQSNVTGGPNYTHAAAGTSVLSAATLNSALGTAGAAQVDVTTDGEIKFDAGAAVGGSILLQHSTAGQQRLRLNAGSGIRFAGGATTFQANTDPAADLLVEMRPGAGGVVTEAGASTTFNVAGTGVRSSAILENGKTWTNLGTVNLYLNGYLQLHDGIGASAFQNAGVVNLWGGGVIGSAGGQSGQFVNQAGGQVEVAAGVSSGRLEAAVDNAGTIAHAGDLQVRRFTQAAAGASIAGAGHLRVLESLNLTGGTFDPTGALSVLQATGNLDLPVGNDVNAGGDVILQAADGSVTLNRRVATTGSMDIGAAGGIALNADVLAARLALVAGAGGIGQGNGGVVRAGELLLQTAAGQSATLASAGNQVGVLAASVGHLSFKSQGPLSLQTVARPLASGSHSGIASGGNVLVETTGGLFTVGPAGVRAASVALRATGVGSAMQVNGSVDAVAGVTTLDTDGELAVGTGNYASLSGRTGLSLRAGADMAFGTSTTGVSLDAHTGSLQIVAGGNVTGGEGWNSFWGSGIGISAGGDVRFGTATAGGISLATNGSGDVSIRANPLDAASDIGGNLYIDTSSSATGTTGNITLQAGGTVQAKSLYASATAEGAAGGEITVAAGGDVHVETANASGSGHGSGTGGAGGRIDIRSHAGRATAGYLYAYGGYGARGGNGGSIAMAATLGDVVLNGSAAADGGGGGGGAAGGIGGQGGIVSLQAAQGTVSFHDVNVRGGYGSGADVAGGRGGSVQLMASTALAASTTDGGAYIDASGGHGGSGTHGAAGGVGGSVLLQVASSTLGLGSGYVQASGGAGGYGDHSGGAGGAGGAVVLQGAAGVTAATGSWVDASGGQGGGSYGTATTDRGGQGGTGGRILVEGGGRSVLEGQLVAAGGDGGDVLASGSAAVSGDGGAGGAIAMSQMGGVLLGGTLRAAGGWAGSTSDAAPTASPSPTAAPAPAPAPLEAARRGTTGANGSVSSNAAGGTTVSSYVYVEGEWANASNLQLAAGSSTSVVGSLTNTGTLGLQSGSNLSMHRWDAQGMELTGTGQLANQGLLEAGGGVHGNVVNAGTLRLGGVGATIGTFAVGGDFSQSATGVLEADVAGPYAGVQHDQLSVTGQVSLGGVLRVLPQPPTGTATVLRTAPQGALLAAALPGAYVPAPGDTFTLVDAQGGVAPGTGFAALDAPAAFAALVRVSSAGTVAPVPITVAPTPAPAPAPTPGPTPAPTPAPTPVPIPAPAPAPSAPIADKIAAAVGADVPRELVAQAVASQEAVLGTFLTLLVKEEEAQARDAEKKKPSGEIVTDTQCK